MGGAGAGCVWKIQHVRIMFACTVLLYVWDVQRTLCVRCVRHMRYISLCKECTLCTVLVNANCIYNIHVCTACTACTLCSICRRITSRRIDRFRIPFSLILGFRIPFGGNSVSWYNRLVRELIKSSSRHFAS